MASLKSLDSPICLKAVMLTVYVSSRQYGMLFYMPLDVVFTSAVLIQTGLANLPDTWMTPVPGHRGLPSSQLWVKVFASVKLQSGYMD